MAGQASEVYIHRGGDDAVLSASDTGWKAEELADGWMVLSEASFLIFSDFLFVTYFPFRVFCEINLLPPAAAGKPEFAVRTVQGVHVYP